MTATCAFSRARRQKRIVPEPVELIRAMRLGRRPEEGTVLKADHSLG
jgi:hypothetical protein